MDPPIDPGSVMREHVLHDRYNGLTSQVVSFLQNSRQQSVSANQRESHTYYILKKGSIFCSTLRALPCRAAVAIESTTIEDSPGLESLRLEKRSSKELDHGSSSSVITKEL